MLQVVLRAVVLSVAIALGGCVTQLYSDPALEAAAYVPPRPSAGPYVLRPNDQLRIQVYNEPTISGDYQIDAVGSISVPLAGRIKAAGLTPVQLERTITRRLDNSGMLKEAHVNVQVSSYGPFYIYGEVKHAGEFPYKPGLTVSDAVALAGGYTYRADESTAYVRGANAATEVARSLDVARPVAPGDTIRIPERWF